MKTISAAEKRWEYIMQERNSGMDYSPDGDYNNGPTITWKIAKILPQTRKEFAYEIISRMPNGY